MFGEGETRSSTAYDGKGDSSIPFLDESKEGEGKENTVSDRIEGLPLSNAGMLVVYTIINFLTYLDRGALSGSLDDMAKDLDNLSSFQQGFLGSAFMGGYMVASPIFAHFVTKFEPLRVMALGLFIWCLATIGCGFSPVYWMVALSRIMTGFGEASFLCIAPPFIDKFAPPGKKSLWLSIFYCTIPVGFAFGFLVSGFILEDHVFGPRWSWRLLFIAEGVLMFPFVLFSLKGKAPFSFKDESEEEDAGTAGALQSAPLLVATPKSDINLGLSRDRAVSNTAKEILPPTLVYPHGLIHGDGYGHGLEDPKARARSRSRSRSRSPNRRRRSSATSPARGTVKIGSFISASSSGNIAAAASSSNGIGPGTGVGAGAPSIAAPSLHGNDLDDADDIEDSISASSLPIASPPGGATTTRRGRAGRPSQSGTYGFVPPSSSSSSSSAAAPATATAAGAGTSGATASSSFTSSDGVKFVPPSDVIRPTKPPLQGMDKFLQSLRIILGNSVYLSLVLGYSAQTFVTGGFAFFGLRYVVEELGINKGDAGLLFGGVTVITGIFGTLVGGVLLDYFRRKRGIPSALMNNDDATDDELGEGLLGDDEDVSTTIAGTGQDVLTANAHGANSLGNSNSNIVSGSRSRKPKLSLKELERQQNNLRSHDNVRDRIESLLVSLKFLLFAAIISLPIALMSFILPTPYAFFLLLLVAEFLLFCCLSPLNNCILWAVPFQLTPQAMALSVVFTHALGDALSPLLMGAMYDKTEKWRLVMSMCSAMLIFSVIGWSFTLYRVNQYFDLVKDHPYSSEFVPPQDPEKAFVALSGRGSPTQPLRAPFSFIRRAMRWHLVDTDLDAGEGEENQVSGSDAPGAPIGNYSTSNNNIINNSNDNNNVMMSGGSVDAGGQHYQGLLYNNTHLLTQGAAAADSSYSQL